MCLCGLALELMPFDRTCAKPLVPTDDRRVSQTWLHLKLRATPSHLTTWWDPPSSTMKSMNSWANQSKCCAGRPRSCGEVCYAVLLCQQLIQKLLSLPLLLHPPHKHSFLKNHFFHSFVDLFVHSFTNSTNTAAGVTVTLVLSQVLTKPPEGADRPLPGTFPLVSLHVTSASLQALWHLSSWVPQRSHLRWLTWQNKTSLHLSWAEERK